MLEANILRSIARSLGIKVPNLAVDDHEPVEPSLLDNIITFIKEAPSLTDITTNLPSLSGIVGEFSEHIVTPIINEFSEHIVNPVIAGVRGLIVSTYAPLRHSVLKSLVGFYNTLVKVANGEGDALWQ